MDASSTAVPLIDIDDAPALEVLPPVTTHEDLPFHLDDDIDQAEMPIRAIERQAIVRLYLSPPVVQESVCVCRCDTLPWLLKESRFVRAEHDRDRLRKEREALIQNMSVKQAEETALKSRLGRMRKEVDSLRTEVERLRGQSQAMRMELRLAREDLAVARDGRQRADAENLQLKRDILELRSSADLRRLLRASQERCAVAEKGLESMRQDIGLKERELEGIRELLSDANLKVTQGSADKMALAIECAGMRLALQGHENKARQDVALHRRHPFLHEHVEFSCRHRRSGPGEAMGHCAPGRPCG